MGELEEAEELCRETMEVAAAHGDRRTEWLATTQHVLLKDSVEPEKWNADEVRRTARQALAVFEELDDDLGLARAWALAGYVDWNACRFESAAKAYERGLAHARRSGDERTQAYLAGNLIAALYYGATPVPEAIARIEELMAEVGSRALEASALHDLGRLLPAASARTRTRNGTAAPSPPTLGCRRAIRLSSRLEIRATPPPSRISPFRA